MYNKEILAKVMKEIQYEDATIRYFSPDLEIFSYIQAFISFCVHAISLLLDRRSVQSFLCLCLVIQYV